MIKLVVLPLEIEDKLMIRLTNLDDSVRSEDDAITKIDLFRLVQLILRLSS